MSLAEDLGTIFFAISGVIAVTGRRLDWFGAIVVGMITAVGGGTMRGLILGQTPVFWIEEHKFLILAFIGAIIGIPVAKALERGTPVRVERGLKVVDAAGLALFAVVGANVAMELGFNGAVAIVAGILTGVGGGVIRDLLAGQTPLVVRGEVYATAALAGVVTFVLLEDFGHFGFGVAGAAGMLVTFGLRMASIRNEWRLPEI